MKKKTQKGFMTVECIPGRVCSIIYSNDCESTEIDLSHL